jgi:hypothetical protein
MSAGKFFFFPICLLAPRDDGQHTTTLNRIISWCVVDTGRKCLERMSELEIKGILKPRILPPDFSKENVDHKAIVLGAKTLKVVVPSCHSILQERGEAEEIRSSHRHHGAVVMLTVAVEFLWECLKGEQPGYRDFCTLCAVNSIIGTKDYPSLVRRELIRVRQIGFKTRKVLDFTMRVSGKKAIREMLTDSELRTSLDRLELKGLITRCAASPRNTYFQRGKVDRVTLRQRVLEIRQMPRRNIAAERARDLAFMEGKMVAQKA